MLDVRAKFLHFPIIVEIDGKNEKAGVLADFDYDGTVVIYDHFCGTWTIIRTWTALKTARSST
jgi:hypothetical protein